MARQITFTYHIGHRTKMPEYYLEIHKAKQMYTTILNLSNFIAKLDINGIIKSSMQSDLNKIKQWLSLPGLKIIKEGEANGEKLV